MGINTVLHPPYSPDLARYGFLSLWDNWGDERGCDEGHWHAHTRGLLWGLPEVVGTVQQVHYRRRRLVRRGQEFHVCTHNKSAHTKKSLETYLMILICVCVCVCMCPCVNMCLCLWEYVCVYVYMICVFVMHAHIKRSFPISLFPYFSICHPFFFLFSFFPSTSFLFLRPLRQVPHPVYSLLPSLLTRVKDHFRCVEHNRSEPQKARSTF